MPARGVAGVSPKDILAGFENMERFAQSEAGVGL